MSHARRNRATRSSAELALLEKAKRLAPDDASICVQLAQVYGLLGFTQEELAIKAGVGIRFIREMEKGKETLQMDKVNQVLKLFGYELGPVIINREALLNEKS